MNKEQKSDLIRICASGVLLLAAVLIKKPEKYAFLFFLPAYLIAGFEVLKETAENLLHGELLDETFLMTVASLGAFIIGEYPEAAGVMIFYELGEWFEDLAVDKSRRSITELTGLRPDTARVLREGAEVTVPPREVAIGETLVLHPGERVPLDGVLAEGCCELDVSALTGESIPLTVEPGNTVSSGSVVLNALVHIKTVKSFEESTASRIIKLVEDSEKAKSKSEAFTARFARIYTPAVCLAALLIAVIPSLITGEWKTWVYRGLMFLVVSCPCALVISVPLSFFAGIGGAAKRGILIKGGQFIEVLAKASQAAFDKTGTLTEGKLYVQSVLPVNGISEEELLSLTASAEQYSTHPIAKCICGAAKKILPATNVKETAGRGVSAIINGKRILAGNKKAVQGYGLNAQTLPDCDGTAVYTFINDSFAGCITVADRAKAHAGEAVRCLKELGLSKTVLLTGDTAHTAEILSGQLGLDSYKAELLPEDKVNALETFMKESPAGLTVYVGDGINDAPVLARADVGVAMGVLGSDAAIEAADVVLMDDDPLKLPLAVLIARKTMRIVKQNIVFSLCVKATILLLGAFGLSNMWLAVFADVGVAALAILNAMRCLRVPKMS